MQLTIYNLTKTLFDDSSLEMIALTWDYQTAENEQ